MSLIFIVAIKAEIVNLVTSVLRGLDFKGGGGGGERLVRLGAGDFELDYFFLI